MEMDNILILILFSGTAVVKISVKLHKNRGTTKDQRFTFLEHPKNLVIMRS